MAAGSEQEQYKLLAESLKEQGNAAMTAGDLPGAISLYSQVMWLQH